MPPPTQRPVLSPELLADLEEDRAKFSTSAGDNYKIPDDNRPHAIRILPGMFGKSKQKFYVAHAQHWVVVEGRRLPMECPAKITTGAPCPFCDGLAGWREYETELRSNVRSSGGVDQMALKRIGRIISNSLPRISYSMNIMARDDASPIVRPYSAPSTVFSVIENNFINNGPDILDPYTGIDFSITKSKKGGRASYSTIALLQPVALWYTDGEQIDESTINDLMEKRIKLDNIRLPDYDEMVNCYNAMVDAVQAGAEDADMRNDEAHKSQQKPVAGTRPAGPPTGGARPAAGAARPAPRPAATAAAAAPRPAARPAPVPAQAPESGGDDVPDGVEDDVPMDNVEPAAQSPAARPRPAGPAAVARPAAARPAGPPTTRPAATPAAAPATRPVGTTKAAAPALMQRLKALQAQEDATPAEGGGEASQELEPEPAE
jgi:hypothetical protein